MEISLQFAVILVLVIGICLELVIAHAESGTQMDWIQNIVPLNYTAYSSPCEALGTRNQLCPTLINFGFVVESVTSVEPKTMDFGADLNIFLFWSDQRLIVPNGNNFVELPQQVTTKLWTPHTVLKNCKRCSQRLIDPRVHRFQLGTPHKGILVSVAGSYTFTCDIKLSNYPFDSQECSIIVEKYAKINEARFHPNDFLKTKINHVPVNAPPAFYLVSIMMSNCTVSSTANSECIKYTFRLRREVTHHVMLVFIPSMLIVILSWISFWLDPDMAAPRVALGLTSLLTLATQFNSAQKDLPPVATIKAIDIWMFACIFIVFSSLIEFSISIHCSRKCKSNTVIQIPTRPRNVAEGTIESFQRSRIQIKNVQQQKKNPGSSIDFFARFAFPIVFFVFNLAYWYYFTSINSD